MKINKLSKLLLLASVLSSAAGASVAPSNGWKYSIGIEGQYYNYREPNLMHLAGWMAGLNVDAIYTFRNNLFTGIEARILGGKAHYSSYRTGKMNNVPQFLSETRGLFGYNWVLNATTTLSPYTGLGYRYKRDSKDGAISTTGHYSYKRESHYLYLPLGLKYQTTLTPQLGLVIRGEYDQLITGEQRSNIFLTNRTLNHRQNSGFGAKASVDVIKKLDNNRVISFGPYFHYWDIKDSEVVAGWLEPRNKTYEAGMSIKYHF